MTASPKAKCKKRKLKLSKEALALAKRYEEIWHEEFYKLARYAQQAVIEEPTGRHASELAKIVARAAEVEENNN
tara:strand:+ start:331 stop:552 length:222 start_codon:yes stop_codon:yes gene_type:complete